MTEKGANEGAIVYAIKALEDCISILGDMSDPNKVNESVSLDVLWKRCVATERLAISAKDRLQKEVIDKVPSHFAYRADDPDTNNALEYVKILSDAVRGR